jgi:pimeloyl-ACP methyl ester carboxylesterase
MGQSYGTLLGLTYAALFPTRVRAMVLDSVIDPALTFNQMTQGQAQGFERVLTEFFAWCAGNADGAWRPAGDPTTALLAQLTAAAATPVPAGGGRAAGAAELYDALLGGLYARTDWPQLRASLAADAAGNGAPAVALSDRYNANGSTNGDDAALAIDCLDHPVGPGLRAAPGLGRGGLRGVARAPDPGGGAGGRPGLTAHPRHRHHRRPGHALRLGGQRRARAQPRRPADAGRQRPRGLLLQRVRAGRRAVVSRQRRDARPGRHLLIVDSSGAVVWRPARCVSEICKRIR